MPRSDPDWLVDAPTAAAYVSHLRGRHCAPGTIWSWATRGHIHRIARGRYDIREIDTWTRRLIVQELIDWLRTQYDHDERQAQDALSLEVDGFEWEYLWLRLGRHDGRVTRSTHEPGAPSPRHVLAHIAANRRILHACTADIGYEDEGLANAIIAQLALPYAERPGYQDAWRPDPTD